MEICRSYRRMFSRFLLGCVSQDKIHLNPLLQNRFFCIGLAIESGLNSLVGSLLLAK
jgi:hypothetical protein